MSMLDLPDSVTFNFPTPILFGLGVRREIGPFLKEHGLKRPLIVTDEGIAPLPMLRDLKVLLEGDGLEPQIFSDMGGNPVKSHVTKGVDAYRAGQCDSIIAVGGGAPWMWPRL